MLSNTEFGSSASPTKKLYIDSRPAPRGTSASSALPPSRKTISGVPLATIVATPGSVEVRCNVQSVNRSGPLVTWTVFVPIQYLGYVMVCGGLVAVITSLLGG